MLDAHLQQLLAGSNSLAVPKLHSSLHLEHTKVHAAAPILSFKIVWLTRSQDGQ